MTAQNDMKEIRTKFAASTTSRRRVVVRLLVVLAIVLVLQSVTVILPVESRIVDASSGKPLQGVDIGAVWNLEIPTLGGAIDGPVVKTKLIRVDDQGRFRLPLTFILHRPLVPFSFSYRSDAYMPRLLACKPGYQEMVRWSNGYDEIGGVLSIRRASRLKSEIGARPFQAPENQEQWTLARARFETLSSDLRRTSDECRSSLICQWDDLSRAADACVDAMLST